MRIKNYIEKYLATLIFCTVLSVIANAQVTVDLSTHVSGTPPAGTVMRWYATTPPPANTTHLSAAQITAAPSGVYYAAYYDTTNNCYSPASKLVVATNSCPQTTVDLTTHTSGTAPAGTIQNWYSSATPSPATKVNNPAAVAAGTYYAAYFDTTNNCYSPVSAPVVIAVGACSQPQPDVAVGIINTPVSGNVSTNDNVPAGTTYGTPIPGGSNPSGATMTMNANGTYTFVATQPGVYTYDVPVCAPGQSMPCPTVPLVITVTDPTVSTNPPVVNTDIASTAYNTPVTVPILANDGPGNSGGTLGTPTITGGVNPGATATINSSGQLVYTPAPGFVGKDTVYYQVCESPGGLCRTASVVITVDAPSVVNSTAAADDYGSTTGTAPVTGNVKTNDSDPQGNTQTVTAQGSAGSPITIAGKGTYYINSDGSYSFTPVAGFTGSVDIPYTVCDNGTPQACANATLYIVVKAPVIVLQPDVNAGVINRPVAGSVATNDNVPAGTTYGTPIPGGSNPSGATMTMNPDGTYIFTATQPGVYTYDVPVCAPGQSMPCPTVPLVITVTDPTVSTNPPVVNTDIATTAYNTPVTVPILANDGPGNSGGTLGTPTITGGVNPGATATINSSGQLVYTPAPGFVGKDTVYYQVCESPGGVCATSSVIITVDPPGAVNSTVAADDYGSTIGTAPVTGNVKTNDSDPQGNTQTVTAHGSAGSPITIAGKGTYYINSDGSYSFTPVAGFTGTADIAYTTCDNGTPQACAKATLHIVVKDIAPDLTPLTDIDDLNFNAAGINRDFIVDVFEIVGRNALHNSKQIVIRLNKLSAFDISVPGITLTSTDQSGVSTTSNVGGGRPNENGNWLFSQNASYIFIKSKPGTNIPANGSAALGLSIMRKSSVAGSTSQNITPTILSGSGGEVIVTNNNSVTTVTAN